MAGELEGKVAVVTGGNTGIGQAVVVALAAQGAKVVIDYVSNEQATQELEQKLSALGETAVAVEADVSKVDDLQRMVDTAVSSFGRLDVLVNNAGVETRTSVLDTTEDQYEKVLAINLKSAFFGTQIAAKQMIAQGGGGRIINMTSVHEDWPMPGNTPYCLSKGGMRMLTRTAGVELAPHNICVVGVGPGRGGHADQRADGGRSEGPRLAQQLHSARSAGRARGDRLGRGLPGRTRGQLHHGHDDLHRRRHHAEQPGTLIDGRRNGDRGRDLHGRSGAAGRVPRRSAGVDPRLPGGRGVPGVHHER